MANRAEYKKNSHTSDPQLNLQTALVNINNSKVASYSKISCRSKVGIHCDESLLAKKQTQFVSIPRSHVDEGHCIETIVYKKSLGIDPLTLKPQCLVTAT